jgi:hypothetical protein
LWVSSTGTSQLVVVAQSLEIRCFDKAQGRRHITTMQPTNRIAARFMNACAWWRTTVVVCALLVVPTPAWADTEAKSTAACAPIDHEHAAWSAVLGRYVRDGVVDYAGLKRAGGPSLDGYLTTLQSVCATQYNGWTREQKLAYWVNAYNAYTVKLILNHYPLTSIRSIGVLPLAAFRETFIPMQTLRGKVLSLNDIEHEILRKEFVEPRIHFAINCASKSCPTLRSDAYRASTLDVQLTAAARAFVSDPTKNRYNAATRTLYLSSIFDWFAGDFERASKTVPAFVARYADPAVAADIASAEVKVEFLEYDWSLNGT